MSLFIFLQLSLKTLLVFLTKRMVHGCTELLWVTDGTCFVCACICRYWYGRKKYFFLILFFVFFSILHPLSTTAHLILPNLQNRIVFVGRKSFSLKGTHWIQQTSLPHSCLDWVWLDMTFIYLSSLNKAYLSFPFAHYYFGWFTKKDNDETVICCVGKKNILLLQPDFFTLDISPLSLRNNVPDLSN